MRTSIVYAVLATALALSAGSAYAANESAAIKQAAADGAAAGQSALQSVTVPTYSADGGRHGEGAITLPGEGAVPLTDLAPGADQAKIEQMKHDAADSATRATAVQQAQTDTAASQSLSAQSYRTARDTRTDQMQALNHDTALWALTRSTLANSAALDAQYANCTKHTSFVDNHTNDGVLRGEATCEELHKPDHAVRSRTLSTRADTSTIFNRTLNFTSTQSFNVDASSGLATGEALADVQMTLAWTGAVENVAITDAPSAYNQWNATITVTVHSPMAAGGGESATITLTAQRTVLTDAIASNPAKPLMGSDAFCTAQWTCDDNTVRTIGGVAIEGSIGAALTALYPYAATNVPPSSTQPICWHATAQYSCPFNIGAMGCWQTPADGVQCHTSTAANTRTDTCATLQQNRQCQQVRTQCNGNASGYGDFCYVSTNTYECTKPVPINTVVEQTHYECKGELACIGDNCVEHPSEVTQSLPRAEAALSVVQHILGDETIDTGQPTAVHHPVAQDTSATPAVTRSAGAQGVAGTPVWFSGEAYECRKATGSTVDCCQEFDSGGDASWFGLYGKHMRRSNAPKAIEQMRLMGAPEIGSWKDLQDPRKWKKSTLDKPFTSPVESVTEGGSTPEESDPGLGGVASQYRQQRSQDSKSGWQCTDPEYDLATQREAGLCEGIGSYCAATTEGACIESRNVYCCFSSPMSRKLVVDAKGGQQGILNGAFGTPQAPQCGGIGKAMVANIDPNAVDVREWTGRHQSGIGYPDAASVSARSNEQLLTGDGSALANPGEHRPTVTERTQTRMGAIQQAAAAESIDANARTLALPAQVDPNAIGEISLAPTFNTARAGLVATVTVRRTGGRGAVGIGYTTADDTARAGTDYTAASGVLTWANGEVGEKTFQIKTQYQPNTNPTAGLSLKLLLSNVTGGAALGEAAGEVRILPGTAPPVPQTGAPHIEVTQRLLSVSPSVGALQLVYEVRLTNVGSEPINNVQFRLMPSRSSFNSLYGDIANPLFGACFDPNGTVRTGTPGAECTTSITLPPGGSVAMQPVMVTDATGPVTTKCSGQATGTISGNATAVNDANCTSTTDAADQPIDSNDWAACYARRGFTTYQAVIQEFSTVFPSQTPPVGGPGAVTVGPTVLQATGFTLPPSMLGNGTIALGAPPPGGNPAPGSVYARLSPCPADVSPPSWWSGDPFSSPACTTLNSDGSSRSSILYQTQGTPSSETCVLTPGKRYYLNVLAANPPPVGGVPSGTTCMSPQCDVGETWAATAAAAPSRATPKVAAAGASKVDTATTLPGCPAAPAGYQRDATYASFERVFTTGTGKLLHDAPAVRLNRQTYAAIPFVSPQDGALLHQIDWTGLGSTTDSKGALITISRCPGDTGQRTKDASVAALATACIGTPDGTPRSAGTIIFQGGGQGAAAHVCRLFPGRPYYINVFRTGIKGSDEATTGCQGKGVLRCGPRVTVK